jgi:hypothetical protein
MTDKPTAYKFRVITFGVPDTNGDVIMRTAINENDLISLVEKKEILAYTLTDDYVDVSVDASRFSVNVVVSSLTDSKDSDTKDSDTISPQGLCSIISLQSLLHIPPFINLVQS